MTPPEIIAFRHPGSQRNGPGWWVRVVPNKFPGPGGRGRASTRPGSGMYDWMNGVGAHEVIIETPEHDKPFAFLDDRQIEDVLWAYRARYLDLKKDPRLKYILIFRNYGRVAGASLSHPHSQLDRHAHGSGRGRGGDGRALRRYESYRDRCVYCDILRQEAERGHAGWWRRTSTSSPSSPTRRSTPSRPGCSRSATAPLSPAISAEEQTGFAAMLGRDAPAHALLPRRSAVQLQRCTPPRVTVTTGTGFPLASGDLPPAHHRRGVRDGNRNLHQRDAPRGVRHATCARWTREALGRTASKLGAACRRRVRLGRTIATAMR